MKNTLLRILVLSVVSAALLRAMIDTQTDVPAGLAARSNNPAEESFIAIWGLSPDAPILPGDVGTNSNDFAVASRVDRLWKAQSETDLCVCETAVPSLPAAKPLLAIQNVLLNGEWSSAESGTGVWVTGSDQWDDCRSDVSGIPDMMGDGLTSYVIPSEANSDCESSLCVEAVEFSRPAQIILIGYGFRFEPPRGDGFASPDGFDPYGREDGAEITEDRLMLVGGPAAIAAIDGSATERVLSVRNHVKDESQHQRAIVIHNPARGSLWTDFLARWERFERAHKPETNFVDGLPLYAPGKASMSSIVTTVATSLNGTHLIAADDGILHLCYRNSGMELCCLKQSPDGVWGVTTQPNRFLSCDDLTKTANESGGGKLDPNRLAAIDPFLRHVLSALVGDQGEIFSFSLSAVR